jgi:hypothetical protein
MHLATVSPDVQTILERLAESASALMMMNYEVKRDATAALERLNAPPAAEAIATYLRTTSNRELRRALIEARGAQGAAVLATKLNRDLAALGKPRPVVNGRRAANGHASGNGRAHPDQLELGI